MRSLEGIIKFSFAFMDVLKTKQITIYFLIHLFLCPPQSKGFTPSFCKVKRLMTCAPQDC